VRRPGERASLSGSAPDLARRFEDQLEPGDLLVAGEVVALDDLGEPGLRRECQLLEGPNLDASSMRCLRSSFFSSAARLVVTSLRMTR
jgi:hypothetical protein